MLTAVSVMLYISLVWVPHTTEYRSKSPLICSGSIHSICSKVGWINETLTFLGGVGRAIRRQWLWCIFESWKPHVLKHTLQDFPQHCCCLKHSRCSCNERNKSQIRLYLLKLSAEYMCKNMGKKCYSLSCTHQHQCSCSCLGVTRTLEWRIGVSLRSPRFLACLGLKRRSPHLN